MSPSRSRSERLNPYRLPAGERLRRELVAIFEAQRKAMIRYLNSGQKGFFTSLPFALPGLQEFGLGALAIARRVVPFIESIWEVASLKFAPKVGLDPSQWRPVNIHGEALIERAALALAHSANATTEQRLDAALQDLRQRFASGELNAADSVDALTEEVMTIFDTASKSRARTIAMTEAARATHAARDQAARASDQVTGWRWLAVPDACDICLAIAARCEFVPLGRPFAIIGGDPDYSTIDYPPLHPNCRCSIEEVLITDPQPDWGDTLYDPEPATEEEQERVIAAMFKAGVISTPAPRPLFRARWPKPLARKRWRKHVEESWDG